MSITEHAICDSPYISFSCDTWKWWHLQDGFKKQLYYIFFPFNASLLNYHGQVLRWNSILTDEKS